MRSVTFPDFCSPCLESLWLHLLHNISLIESVVAAEDLATSTLRVKIDLIPFGGSSWAYQNLQTTLLLESTKAHLTTPSRSPPEYEIVWTRQGSVLEQYANSTTIELRDWKERDRGALKAYVRLHTLDVRSDPEGRLLASKTI